jgi:O-antigen/teichoic acid export membrane protein
MIAGVPAFQRFAIGTVVTGGQVVVALFVQIALVPIYLTHWDLKRYGIWLTAQAATALLAIIDLGHQNLLGYEFQMIGSHQPVVLAEVMYSAIPIGVIIGLFELIVLAIGIAFGVDKALIGASVNAESLQRDFDFVVAMQLGSWVLTGSVGGLLGRVLVTFGQYARVTAWGGIATLVTSLSPALAVASGANLFQAGLASAISVLAINVVLLGDFVRILIKVDLRPVRPKLDIGFNNLLRSLALAARQLVEMFRQQGIRLLIAPLAGSVQLAEFVTNRTVGNVLLQGYASISGPLVPELIRFMSRRDKERMSTAFHLTCFFQVCLAAPLVLAGLLLFPAFFTVWTRGKVEFDPILFLLFSFEIMLVALGTGPRAIVQGSNQLRLQLISSIISAAVLLGLTMVTVPFIGVRGVALGLVSAELSMLFGYVIGAHHWVERNAMRPDYGPFFIAGTASMMAGFAGWMVVFAPSEALVVLALLFIPYCLIVWEAWRRIPRFAASSV